MGTKRACCFRPGRASGYTATGERLIRVVVARDPEGSCNDRAFLSTDLAATPKQMLERFPGWWLIEVSFRDAKHYLG